MVLMRAMGEDGTEASVKVCRCRRRSRICRWISRRFSFRSSGVEEEAAEEEEEGAVEEKGRSRTAARTEGALRSRLMMRWRKNAFPELKN
jgi:hypothetical protein